MYLLPVPAGDGNVDDVRVGKEDGFGLHLLGGPQIDDGLEAGPGEAYGIVMGEIVDASRAVEHSPAEAFPLARLVAAHVAEVLYVVHLYVTRRHVLRVPVVEGNTEIFALNIVGGDVTDELLLDGRVADGLAHVEFLGHVRDVELGKAFQGRIGLPFDNVIAHVVADAHDSHIARLRPAARQCEDARQNT